MVRETVRNKPTVKSVAASAIPEPSSKVKSNVSESREAAQPSSSKTADNEARMYSHFMSLGAPEVGEQEFGRLCRGPLADALLFAAEHVKGRSETASARVAIQSMRETGKNKHVDTAESSYLRARHANARTVCAKNDYESMQATLNDFSKSVAKLENEVYHLQKALENKRMTIFLLKILKRKENMHSARFAELIRLLEDLRENAPPKSGFEKLDAESNDSPPYKPSPSFSLGTRVEPTRDVLAALRAHHVQLSRFSKYSANSASTGTAETRLLKTLASAMKLPEDNVQVIAGYTKCLKLAKIRARENLQYQSPLDPKSTSEADDINLDAVLKRVIHKENNVQHLSDSAVALQWSCGRAVQSISAFVETTIPELRESLREEASVTEGYVDALRLSVVNRAETSTMTYGSADTGSPYQHEGKAWHRTLEEVQTAIEETYAREQFLRRATLLDSSNAHQHEHRELIATHMELQAKADERIGNLLARKLEKARVGDVLTRDVEQLATEVKIVASLVSPSERS
ncbi:hypothetical protein SCP_1000880 [Sparassis crispa]|uniref:Uncharacterized protein n=1 Tax=Sparassis crispa TaxID=139825 RepID=A0A401GX85_9APHY|nr:hypothetical protein SCP_1000880 [Sparassis crispa]GBE86846.1 hypothetical protein SCP_1000880 [Sparassis crispa]